MILHKARQYNVLFLITSSQIQEQILIRTKVGIYGYKEGKKGLQQSNLIGITIIIYRNN